MTVIEIIAVLFVGAVSAGLCASGLAEMKRVSSPKKAKTDQKCPHCDKWQSEHGGWAWVGNTENPEIDFAAVCGGCGIISYWVWIGPGVCVRFEEIKKQRARKVYVKPQLPLARNPVSPPGDE